MRVGALEAGGTKMVCAVVEVDGGTSWEILERVSIPTKTPQETIPAMVDFFKGKGIEALGIACFGPVDLHRDSPTYGFITTTPKAGWANCDIVGPFREALGVPVGFDTDVNGSLLGEATFGGAKGLENSVYITIGTGVGAGIMSNGRLLHGMLHPEAGHVTLKRHETDRDFACNCPFHDSCFEGLAAGPAIEKRWGRKGTELAGRPEVWELEAYYIAQALLDYIMVLSPEKIILGGGVMHQPQLLPLIREEVRRQINGYIRTAQMENPDEYITEASLGDDQGILGACCLATEAKACHYSS
ncbi:MAG: ROK family protein [Lachnospiraceae bacterium]|nr:ROK family protein [Lachnospiraceae bacterium]